MLHLLDFMINAAFTAVILLMGPPALLVAIAMALHKLSDLSKPSDDEIDQPAVTAQPPEPETIAKPVSSERSICDPLADRPKTQPSVPQQTTVKPAQPVSDAQRRKARQIIPAAKKREATVNRGQGKPKATKVSSKTARQQSSQRTTTASSKPKNVSDMLRQQHQAQTPNIKL